MTQAVVEVGAQGIHAVESNPVRGQSRQVASEGARDTEEPHRRGCDSQIEDGRLLGGARYQPCGGAAQGDGRAERSDAEQYGQGKSRA